MCDVGRNTACNTAPVHAVPAADLLSLWLHSPRCRVAQWLVFSDVWNAIVDELRSVDLLSETERRNLSFVHLPIDDSIQARCSPLLRGGTHVSLLLDVSRRVCERVSGSGGANLLPGTCLSLVSSRSSGFCHRR